MRGLKLTVLATAVFALLCLAGPAFAAKNYPPEPDTQPTRIQRDNPRAEVLPNREERGGVLPFTGAELTVYVVLGAGAILIGTLIVRKSRSHS